jgi:type II secretory pathway component PulF
MKFYRYKAFDKKGKEITGIKEANSINSLKKQLISDGLIPIEIEEISPEQKEKKKKSLLRLEIFSKRKLSDLEMALLLYEIGLLLSRGVYITEIFEILSKQTEKKELQEVLLSVKTYVQEGKNLADALEKVKVFPEFLIEMVRAGEESGALDKIFLSASEFVEKQAEFKSKIINTLTYPSIVIFVGLIAMAVIMKFTIPKITAIYEQFDRELPLATKIVISISKGLDFIFKLIPVFIILGFILKKKYIQKRHIDKLKLKIPFFNKIHLYSQYATWSNTMAILLKGGLTLDKALEIANKTLSNVLIREKFETLTDEVRKGKNLSELIKEKKLLPDNATQLIKIGEETAQLDDMFSLISNIYKKNIDNLISLFLKYLEPASLMILSLLIGFFIFATMIPLFSLKMR